MSTAVWFDMTGGKVTVEQSYFGLWVGKFPMKGIWVEKWSVSLLQRGKMSDFLALPLAGTCTQNSCYPIVVQGSSPMKWELQYKGFPSVSVTWENVI